MKIILFCNKGFTIFKFSLINVYYTISMELFLKILEQLIQSAQIVKRNKDLEQIIEILRVHTKKQLGFMCES